MRLFLFLSLLCLAGVSTACDDSKSSRIVNVGFHLTDAPTEADYKAVLIDVQRLSYSTNGEAWAEVPIKPAVVDILQLTNGADTLLANIPLLSGMRVEQLRLVLGDDNSLVLSDGTSYPLDTPSGQTSGIKLNVHSEARLTSGYRVVLDFDAARSIVARGNGTYGLKPVIRAFIEANTSAISGLLLPSNTPARVFTVTEQGDTLATISDTTRSNYFLLRGLFSGTYNVQTQDLTTHEIFPLKSGIVVVGGTNVNLGTLELPF